MTVVLWVAAIALIAIGVAGTILPAIPGVTLVFLGMLLAAWIDDFARIPLWLVVIFAILTAVAWAIDYLAAAAGAKRAGASKLAVLGAMIGTVAGIFMGFVGLLFINVEADSIEALSTRGLQALSPLLNLRHKVVLEVTERSAIRDIPVFRESLGMLRERGFRIAIDDAGSGYASLQSIAELRPNFLKVASTLVTRAAGGPRPDECGKP